jgi:hypothetical protein
MDMGREGACARKKIHQSKCVAVKLSTFKNIIIF